MNEQEKVLREAREFINGAVDNGWDREDGLYMLAKIDAALTAQPKTPMTTEQALREAAQRLLHEAQISQDKSQFRDDIELLAQAALAAPAPAATVQPLTDEQIQALYHKHIGNAWAFTEPQRAYARALLAAQSKAEEPLQAADQRGNIGAAAKQTPE
jgi:hypothetical protein